MGNTQNKQNYSLKSAANYYDAIAVHYILTQNFKDLKALTTKEGCDKIVILTKKVLEKYLNSREIEYLAYRVENGAERSVKKKEKLTFIKPLQTKVKESKKITAYQYKDDDGMGTHYLNSKKTPPQFQKKKGLKHELDVKDRTNKQRMCNGIASFYIKIAHLYAAMMKSVNPIYKYKDAQGESHEYSILNRDKIPDGADVTVSEVNLCNRRIKALSVPQKEEGKITVGVRCNVNKKKKKNKFKSDEFSDPMDWGKEEVLARTLGEEPGIKNLLDLYKDKYNPIKGEWDGMKPETLEKLKRDTKTFYKAFTGKGDSEYNQWNSDKTKTFADIPLVDYHNSQDCEEGGNWRRQYTGESDDPLFKAYADNLKTMLTNAKKNQDKLLKLLDKVFQWQNPETTNPTSGESKKPEKKILSLHKDLNERVLDGIILEARKILVDIYLTCEREYKKGLQIFTAIVSKRALERDVNRELELKEQEKKSISSDVVNTDTENLIKKEITDSVADIAAIKTEVST